MKEAGLSYAATTTGMSQPTGTHHRVAPYPILEHSD
jgi:hypothetical protein